MKCIPIMAAVVMLSSVAFAKDSPSTTLPSALEIGEQSIGGDWKGFYAGLQSGSGNASLTDENGGEDLGDFTGYGFHFGRLVDHGRFLAGAEVDAAMIRRDADEGRHKLLRFKTVFGVDLGRFAPYGVFGTAYFIPDNPDLNPSSGLVYGLGANMRITDDLTLGIEHTKQGFDDFSGYPGTDVNAALTQFRASFRF